MGGVASSAARIGFSWGVEHAHQISGWGCGAGDVRDLLPGCPYAIGCRAGWRGIARECGGVGVGKFLRRTAVICAAISGPGILGRMIRGGALAPVFAALRRGKRFA